MDIGFLFETLDVLEHKEYAKALENSLETITKNPNDLEALKIAVKCLMEDGRKPAYTSVLEYTERILKQEPDNIDAKISRIKALRRLERVEAASILLDRLEKTEPNNPTIDGPVQTERQKLEKMAQTLRIDVVDKSDIELKNAIDAKFGPQESNSENKFKN